MNVSELNHVLAGCRKITYKDKFTNTTIDYNNLNRREQNRFRQRNIYLAYPQNKEMIVVVY